MDTIVLLILLIATAFVVYYYTSNTKQSCPPQTVYYKIDVPSILDQQFSESNFPSNRLESMFINRIPWIGGGELGNNKLITTSQQQTALANQNSTLPMNP
jgi:hypothetical protein